MEADTRTSHPASGPLSSGGVLLVALAGLAYRSVDEPYLLFGNMEWVFPAFLLAGLIGVVQTLKAERQASGGAARAGLWVSLVVNALLAAGTLFFWHVLADFYYGASLLP